ncbi:DinB family protein [Streptomyces sp. NPDC051014]|uniref:DinB family protein n=1 Tax=Streptomyces sp. NPDC051014 TaxID=3155751 RepID=UPI0033D65584
MTTERREPAFDADERTSLEGWLEFHRRTLAMKCEGLTDAQLGTASVEPSPMSLMGLVRHMTDVERFWYRTVLVDEAVTPLYWTDEDPDADFRLGEGVGRQEAYANWQAEIGAARRNAAGFALDDLSRGRHRRSGQRMNLRWIHTHMIEEYARHNGHADLIRERIDGVTGD